MLRFQQVLSGAALCGTFFFSAGLRAQAVFTDPANLRGERVKPHDGRELPIDQGARGLEQMLRKLNTRASLMFIVAHPDDEDGGMLTYCSRGLGARVAMLTLTRGEGGQNAMTGDFEDALGLLRTQELLAADRYFGVDQMFGTEVDFGFSKTKEEAFSKWTHERVLYDAVRAVRLYRPMVIAATFIGGVTDGHGQHQVSGEIAQEVFNAAGDPKVFPELTAEGILPWQPLKVYARVPMGAITSRGLFDYATGQYAPAKFTNYVSGEVTTSTPSADVIVHEGKADALLSAGGDAERSYVQFARIGLGQQKSQIGSGVRVPPAGAYDVGYHRYGSKIQVSGGEDSFFSGIDTSLGAMGEGGPQFLSDGLAGVDADIRAATAALARGGPASTAPLLANAAKRIRGLLAEIEQSSLDSARKASVLHELRVKKVQLNDALILALSLTLDATTHGADQRAGTRPLVSASLRSEAASELSVGEQWIENGQGTKQSSGMDRAESARVSQTHPFLRTFTPTADLTTEVTRPPFDRKSIEEPVYRLQVAALRNAPASPPALTVWENVDYRGVPVEVGRVVHDGAQPLEFVPEVSVAIRPEQQLLLPGVHSVPVGVRMQYEPSASGSVAVQGPSNWLVSPKKAGLAGVQAFAVAVPTGVNAPVTLTATASALSGGVYREGYRTVGYGELPRTHYFTPATLRLVPADLRLPAHQTIGYLPGTGDAVPEALSSIGLKVSMLTVADLNQEKLAGFDTVILGVRTYAAHKDLHGAPTQALMAFARAGGNVVVQYQTAEFTDDDSPFPLTLGGDAEKVVDETDAVKLLDRGSVSVSSPNKLTSADFNGWVEERGHGFLRSWDASYIALTETADPGQEPQRGGWITTKLGRGHWTYCAFALYRQLPVAVPGAYRILMNQLALADER